ncbi:MAG: type II toxin-antitoxin system Phd/YefM family antitoxin [Aestuariivirga sp.]
MTRITATEAARNFSDILNRAQYRGESFEVTRGGEVAVRIEPGARKGITWGEFLERVDSGPRLDPEDSKLFEEQLVELRRSLPTPKDPWE